MQQRIVINIEGDTKGLQKSAQTGAQALASLNTQIVRTAQVSAQARGATIQLRSASGEYTSVVAQARIAAAALGAEKARMTQIDDLLTKSLKKEELQLLRNAGAMNTFRGATGSADFALLSLTQGIQDAGNFGMGMAQGIRAVNNNLQAFMTAMSFSIAQSGGLTKSLSAMGRAMIGPAGILFAFSAISAAIEFFANRSQMAKRKTEELEASLDSLVDVIGGSRPKVAVTTAFLRFRISELTQESERLEGVTEMIGGNWGVYTRQTKAAAAAQKLVNEELEALKELLPPTAENLRKYLAFITSTENLNARSEEVGDGLSKTLAELKVALELAPHYQDTELAIKRLEKQIELVRFPLTMQEDLLDMALGVDKLKLELEMLQGPEGDRLAALLLQTEQLERQVANAKALNRLEAIGAPLGIASVQPRGLDSLPGLSADEMKGPDRLFMPWFLANAISDQEKFRKIAQEQEAINAQMSAAFAKLGADLITSFTTIGGGFDMFTRQIGRFMGRLGSQMIEIGLTTELFGKAMIAFKAALKANPYAAIAAGIALSAIGARLASKSKNAANNPGQNDGLNNHSFPAPGFGAFNSGSSSGLFGGTSFMPASSAASLAVSSQPMQITGRLVGEGRSLVAVIGSEVQVQRERGISNPLGGI